MTNLSNAHQRIHYQCIVASAFKKPVDVVKWLGAVQAQDYLGSLWAIGLRTKNPTEAAIEQAIADRTIVRTWPMRGTLHFVAPEDVRWMLKLLTPRIIARSARRYQQLELDDATFAKSKEVLVNALQGDRQLARHETYQVLERANISTASQRGIHILCRLAQEGLLCFGAREGKQPTFALLDEWVPPTRMPERDEALAELAKRYFTSHGPATLRDFVWWSGLTIADARNGVEHAKDRLHREVIDGQAYWLSPSVPTANAIFPTAYLLPNYDEYIVGYADRSASFDGKQTKMLDPRGNIVFNNTVVIDGQIAGTWKRKFRKNSVVMTISTFLPLTEANQQLLADAAERYAAFLGLLVDISWG